MMLTLDLETHTYRADGRVVPSVTTILKDRGLIEGVEYFTPQSAQRGTDGHMLVHFFEEDDLDPASITPQMQGYLNAYIRFKRETRFERLFGEMSLYHPTLNYAGTPDALGWLHERLTLVDYKTGAYQRSHDLQLAGYLDLIATNGPELFGLLPGEIQGITACVVELRANGTYKVHPMKLSIQAARAYFHAALMCTRFMEGK